ncbi:MAG: sulfotransferase [Amaricoccus sp.]
MGGKVFGIGFHKTGTTTLRDALMILGYRVTGPNGTKDPEIAAKLDEMVEDLSARFDAFQDNPWPLVYRKMDALYPGSKFVLTVRDPERWIASAVRDFAERDSPMRQLIYGVGHPKGHEALYIARMQAHNAEVAEYFRDRPGDLITLDWSKRPGWEPLCDFLGMPVPKDPFPHANTARQTELRRKYGGLGRVAGKFVRPE